MRSIRTADSFMDTPVSSPSEKKNFSCPLCASALIEKEGKLYCASCAIFIGEQGGIGKAAVSARPFAKRFPEEQKRIGAWKIIGTLLRYCMTFFVIGAGIAAYELRPWNFFLESDYSGMKKIQKLLPFKVYALKSAPPGYLFDAELSIPSRDEKTKRYSLDLVYNLGNAISAITVSHMALEDALLFTGAKTKEEFFLGLMRDRTIRKISRGGYEFYVSVSGNALTAYGMFKHTGIVFTVRDNTLIRVAYEGIEARNEEDMLVAAFSLSPLENL